MRQVMGFTVNGEYQRFNLDGNAKAIKVYEDAKQTERVIKVRIPAQAPQSMDKTTFRDQNFLAVEVSSFDTLGEICWSYVENAEDAIPIFIRAIFQLKEDEECLKKAYSDSSNEPNTWGIGG